MNSKYIIKNIERGKGARNQYMYASLYNAETGELLISATLDYIEKRMWEIIPPEEKDADNEN